MTRLSSVSLRMFTASKFECEPPLKTIPQGTLNANSKEKLRKHFHSYAIRNNIPQRTPRDRECTDHGQSHVCGASRDTKQVWCWQVSCQIKGRGVMASEYLIKLHAAQRELSSAENEYIANTPCCDNSECHWYDKSGQSSLNCRWTTEVETCREYIHE